MQFQNSGVTLQTKWKWRDWNRRTCTSNRLLQNKFKHPTVFILLCLRMNTRKFNSDKSPRCNSQTPSYTNFRPLIRIHTKGKGRTRNGKQRQYRMLTYQDQNSSFYHRNQPLCSEKHWNCCPFVSSHAQTQTSHFPGITFSWVFHRTPNEHQNIIDFCSNWRLRLAQNLSETQECRPSDT